MKTFADFGIDLPHGRSGEVDTLCPECSPTRKNSRDKCLSVNTDLGTWHCHHCGWSGGLGGAVNTRPAYGAPLKRKEFVAPPPIVPAPTRWQKALAWFAGRGISEPTLTKMGVSVEERYCARCEATTGHIAFPYFRGDTHINTKYRCANKHFTMAAGAERVLYNLNGILNAETAIIVEGEMDALSLMELGFTNVVSVPDGAPSENSVSFANKFTFLEGAESTINRLREVVIATDADGPGQTLMEELCRRIGYEKCKRVTWPEGIKDANECLMHVGPDELHRCIAEAEPYPIEGLITVDDLDRDIESLFIKGPDQGLSVFWPAMDRHYRIRPGLMTVVTGIPSHGKSTWLNHYMVRLADFHEWKFVVCSPEQQPVHAHALRLISLKMGKSIRDMTLAEMREGKAWVKEHFVFDLPEQPNLDTILDRARIAVYRHGVRGVVIDPWTEIEAFPPPGMNSVDHLNQCLSKMRRFAIHNDVHLWLVAHPTKLHPESAGAEEPVPSLYNIAGGAHFRNKADYGIVVWRNVTDTSQPVEVHVQKVRFDETGDNGIVEFRYDPSTRAYREA